MLQDWAVWMLSVLSVVYLQSMYLYFPLSAMYSCVIVGALLLSNVHVCIFLLAMHFLCASSFVFYCSPSFIWFIYVCLYKTASPWLLGWFMELLVTWLLTCIGLVGWFWLSVWLTDNAVPHHVCNHKAAFPQVGLNSEQCQSLGLTLSEMYVCLCLCSFK